MSEIPRIPQLSVMALKPAAQAPAAPPGLFEKALKGVNATMNRSAELKERYQRGDSAVGLSDVMIAGQQSEIALMTAIEIRNKLVESYKTISSMPV